LRLAALATRPWQHSTGPRTPEGKSRAAVNGKARQNGPKSVRELRADMAEIRALIGLMQAGRKALATGADARP